MKVSYSLLNLWHQGRYDDAIAAFQGNWMPANPQMAEGTAFHKAWEEEVRATNQLPAVFGAKALKNPKPEAYTKIQLLDWLWVSGMVDLEDEDTGYEYKTGTSNAAVYARSWQHKVYKVLRPKLKYFEYHCYNQYSKVATMERIHLSEKVFDDGLEWIITNASDLRATLEQMGIATDNETVVSSREKKL
jgi:hypothetical protein